MGLSATQYVRVWQTRGPTPDAARESCVMVSIVEPVALRLGAAEVAEYPAVDHRFLKGLGAAGNWDGFRTEEE